MIGDILVALVIVFIIETWLGADRKRKHREEIAQAYLNGIHAANRVHREIAAIPKSDSRH